MYSLSFLILCSLLQAGNDTSAPRLMDRQPIPQPTQFAPPALVQPNPIATTPMATPPTAASPPTAANTDRLYFQNGILELPKYNHVILAATERAVLISLNTEQRDADGNIVLDSDGNPVMIPITRGMPVFKGQVLGKFDDRELRSILTISQAQLEVAKAERDKRIEVVLAARSVQVAIADLNRLIEGNKRVEGTFAEVEVQRAWLAQQQAEANLDLQKYNIDVIKTREVLVRESELERAEDQIGLRQLVSSIDGMIVGINAAEGEWLREGQEVLEIMQLGTLLVRVGVSAERYMISDLDGKRATIQITLANGKTETFQGIVVFCHPVIQAGSNTFEVFIEVQNRRVGDHWLLQPGRAGVDVVIPL